MEAKLLPLMLTSIANLALAIYVYRSDRESIVNKTFCLFVVSLVGWNTSLILVASATTLKQVEVFGRLAFAMASVAIANFLLFSLAFPNKEWKIAVRYLFFLYIPCLIFLLLSPTNLIQSGVKVNSWGFSPELGSAHLFYTIYIAFYGIAGLVVLAKKYVTSEKAITREQLKYLFWGMLLLIIPSVAADAVLVALGIPQLYVIGPSFAIFFTGFTAYAIVKYRLMDIKIVLRKGLIYLISSIILVGVFGLFFIVIPATIPTISGYHLALLSAVCVACSVIAFQPLKENISRFIFKEQHHYRQTLKEFSQAITGVLDLDIVLELLVDTVMKTMKVEKASLWLLDDTRGEYCVQISEGAQSTAAKSLKGGSKIIKSLKRAEDVLIKGELERHWQPQEFDEIDKDFQLLEAEICVPLFAKERLIGILALGNKIVEGIYSNEDVGMLLTLANQSAIAIQNAQLHKSEVEAKDYIEAILQNMDSGVIAIDSLGRIVTLNNAAAKILGAKPNDILNEDVEVLKNGLKNILLKTLRQGEEFQGMEMPVTTLEDKEIPMLVSTATLKSGNNDATGALVVFSDISKLKFMEKQMIQAGKLSALGTLAAGLAHEIKNPLFSIKTFFQLYPELREEDEEELQNLLQVAEKEVERIHRILGELLNLGRPSSHSFDWCDVNQIIDDTLLLLKKQFRDKGVIFVDNREEDLPEIFGDSDQLKQIFLNIMLNAVQAIDGDNGGVTVETRQGAITPKAPVWQDIERKADEKKWVTIKISDTGVGIPGDKQQHIFDPFYTTKETGTGLGLAVVHSLIENHGGKIMFESEEGVGSAFIIELPVLGEPESEVAFHTNGHEYEINSFPSDFRKGD